MGGAPARARNGGVLAPDKSVAAVDALCCLGLLLRLDALLRALGGGRRRAAALRAAGFPAGDANDPAGAGAPPSHALNAVKRRIRHEAQSCLISCVSSCALPTRSRAHR